MKFPAVAASGWRRLRADDRIAILAAAVLAAVTLSTVAAVFARLEVVVERMLAGSLAAELADRREVADGEIERLVEEVLEVSSREAVTRAYAAGVSTRPLGDDLAQLAAVRVRAGHNGVAFLDPEGRTLAAAGRFVEESPLRIALRHPHASGALLWERVLVLDVWVPLTRGGREIGALRAQRRLEGLSDSLTAIRAMGRSA